MPGYLGHLTGKDLPTPFGILPVSQDEHALCPEIVRFVGDPVAAVAATSEDAAWEAARRVRVEIEPLPTVASVEEALANPGAAHPRLRRRGQPAQEGGDGVRRRRRRLRGGRPGARGHGALRGQHPPADGAARDAGLAGGRRPGERPVLHPDAALPAPRAGQGARPAAVARAGDRRPVRRRLRRQERSVQPRDRRRRDGAEARPSGEGGAHPRGGLLLPPRPPSGADASPDRLHARTARSPPST